MIKELTKEQTEKLAVYKDKWIAIGLDTKRANKSVAEQAAKDAYREAGLEEPKIFIWVDSPRGGLIAAKLIKEVAKKYKTFDASQVWDQVRGQVGGQVGDQVGDQVWDQVRDQVGDQVWGQVWGQVGGQVRDQVGDQVWDQVRDQVGDQVRDQVRGQVGDQVWDQVWDQVRGQVGDQVWDQNLREEWNELGFWGCHDAGWLSFYDYFLEVCGLEVCKRLKPLMTIAQESGWTWFYRNVVIFTEKPTEVHRNSLGQLHNFDSAAVKYADGYEVNMISRVRVPEYIVKTERHDFTKEMILSEKNADNRRCIIQKIGIVKAISVLGAETVDTYESKVGGKYELLMIDYDGRGERRPYLKMQNPSINEFHIEGCGPNVKTVKEAIMYRNKLKTFIEPDVLS